jgi:hypothetical protein
VALVKAEDLEAIIALLPPGADVAGARATLGTLAVFWDIPAAPAASWVDRPTLRAVTTAASDPSPVAQRRALAAAALLGERSKREALLAALLGLWAAAGGELTTGTGKTGSPCARYLAKAVTVITGKFTVSAAREAIRRYRRRRTPRQ